MKNQVNPERDCRPRRSRVEGNLVSLAPAPASRHTLFCFHHAGGGAAGFRNWPRLLGPSSQLATIVLPGRESSFGKPPLTEVVTAVERVCDNIQPLTDRPYALFGHSLGAVLAFETACRLEKSGGRAPSCLIVSGRRALHLQDPDAHMPPARSSSTLPDDEFIALLRRYGGTPSEILDNREMMEIFLPLIRADFRMAETYRWNGRSRVACPILVLGGLADRYAKPEELDQWRHLTTGETTVRTFDGGHFFVSNHEAGACGAIAAFLNRHIGEC